MPRHLNDENLMSGLTHEIAKIRQRTDSSAFERVTAVDALIAQNNASFLDRYVELRDRVVKGDLTALDQGMASVGNIIKLRQDVLPTLCEAEFLARNFDLCAPLLLEAFNGSKNAQLGYEESRLLHPFDTPIWSRKVISKRLLDEFGSSVPTRISIRTLHEPSGGKSMVVHYFAPRWDLTNGTTVTYRSSVRTVDLADEVRAVYELDRENASLVLAQRLANAQIDGSLPWIGEHVAKRDRRLNASLLGARLLDDARTLFALPLDDRDLERILSSSREPWDVVLHSLTKKAAVVGKLLAINPALESHGRALMIVKDPEKRALQIQAELKRREKAHDAQVQCSEEVESPIAIKPEISLGLGIRGALETYTALSPNEVRELARNLKACIRRGAGSFASLVERLKAGETGGSILGDFRQSLTRIEIQDRARSEIQLPTSSPQPSLEVINEIFVHARHFRKKLEGLPASLRCFVEERLLRIKEDGYEGDCEKLHGADLYMLRIDKGPGIRVYYTKVSPTVWSFISLGTKKDYTEVQIRASKFLAAGYLNEPYL